MTDGFWFSTKFDMPHQSLLINSLCATLVQYSYVDSLGWCSQTQIQRFHLQSTRRFQKYDIIDAPQLRQPKNQAIFIQQTESHLARSTPFSVKCEYIDKFHELAKNQWFSKQNMSIPFILYSLRMAQCQTSSSLFNCLIRFEHWTRPKKVLFEFIVSAQEQKLRVKTLGWNYSQLTAQNCTWSRQIDWPLRFLDCCVQNYRKRVATKEIEFLFDSIACYSSAIMTSHLN